jgi:sensor histidine kinase YesM
MQKHPILQNYKTQLLYIAIWLAISGIEVFAVSHAPAVFPRFYVGLHFALNNIIMALLLLAVWFPVTLNAWENRRWDFYLVAHIFLGLFVIAISVAFSGLIVWVCAGDILNYMHYVQRENGILFAYNCIYYLVVVLVYYLCIFMRQVSEKKANEKRLKELIKDNELNFLKSQINPHFLFNSLNSLNSLMMRDVERAQTMLLALSDYLRHTVMASNNPYFTLRQEIENVERYLSIEKLRFGNKLEKHIDIEPECMKAKMLSMLLQPLFENAVKHGVYESLQPVCISARATCDNGVLTIIIENNYDAQHPVQRKGSGTGLRNIRERLQLSYAGAASLTTKKDADKFTAILKIPYQT